MKVKLSDFGKDERSLLLFFETCAVDYGGRVDRRRMNDIDAAIARRWHEEKFIKFGRIVARHVNSQGSSWCQLSDTAWSLAHQERKNRAERMWLKRKWLSTEENTNEHGIAAVRLGAVDGQELPFEGEVKVKDKATRG